jgi:hypothetical protein
MTGDMDVDDDANGLNGHNFVGANYYRDRAANNTYRRSSG